MENIIDRLEKYMAFKDLNDNKVTVQANLTNSLIGKARKNRKGLHSDTIESILNTYTDLNPVWFILGKGDMILPENDENVQNELKEDYNKPKKTSFKPKQSGESDLIQLIREKDDRIVELATKVGKLETTVELLKKENPQVAYRIAAEPK